MKVLVVGSGGREHALCWALAASPLVTEVVCAPGNAGIAAEARCVPVAADDVTGLVALAQAEGVGLVVVGPEVPLVLGLVDRLAAAGIKAFGPTAAAARLEGSKGFTKAFCAAARYPDGGLPHLRPGRGCGRARYVEAQGAPIVVKADGLAAGKGVVVAASVEEALAAVDDRSTVASGPPGRRSWSRNASTARRPACSRSATVPMRWRSAPRRTTSAPMTATSAPTPAAWGPIRRHRASMPTMIERVMAEIIRPTLAGMAEEGAPFKGILYAGLMLTASGPKLIEYNVRFGDPECQVILPRLLTDLAQLLLGAVDGMLTHMSLRWRPEHALTVVMASRGYPGDYAKGTEIRGLDALEGEPGLLVFHAGTKLLPDGRLVANGGRVLGVTGLGTTLAAAQAKAYGAAERIDWPEGFYRRDIGWRALSG